MIRNSKIINNIETEVVHSKNNVAYNVISTIVGNKYKIARVPYLKIEQNETLTKNEHDEALTIATFISDCFNNSNIILENFNLKNKLIDTIDSIQNRQLQLVGYMNDYKGLGNTIEFNNSKIKYDVLELVKNNLIDLIDDTNK